MKNERRKMQALRLKLGMSQEDLARKSGVPSATIKNAEQGRTILRLDTAVKIAQALGVPVDELIDDWMRAPEGSAPPQRGAFARKK
jgi:transcriptional regulator with XRE-family HTH domain